jgi:glucose-1-phosphate thymidylyltransferase
VKGIILAGGSGTRLYPLTVVVSKQLLPIYDKPMIYYPLSTLMHAGIKDILIISTPSDIGNYERLLGDGSTFGIKLGYLVQPSPDGLAQAFIIGEDFIDGEPCAMILGDNIFYGDELKEALNKAYRNAENGRATIFCYPVPDPERFGIVEFDSDMRAISIEEKPKNPKTNYCVTGLYFYDGRSSKYARAVKPSSRNELEITDLNRAYLDVGDLDVYLMKTGCIWMDTGTFDSLNDASNLVRMLSETKDMLAGSPEAVAYDKGWITKSALIKASEKYGKSPYGKQLKKLVESE